MTPLNNEPSLDPERRVEALLQTAADYEPESPMPAGLEAHALEARAPNQQAIAIPWQPLTLFCGVAISIGLLYCCFFRTPSIQGAKPPHSRTFYVGVRHGQGTVLSVTAAINTVQKQIRRAKSAKAAVIKTMKFADSRQMQPAILPRSTEHPSTEASIPRRKLAGDFRPQDGRPLGLPGGYFNARPVWRTEIVETETVGFASPALITREDSEQHTLTITPAYVAYPVRDGDVFCALHKGPVETESDSAMPIHSGDIHENH